MTESTALTDLLAAQSEMPTLQKSGINPHFKNRYVPLEELLTTVTPILNKHRFVLVQMPTIADGEPALEYSLIHVSGERFGGTMLLMAPKDNPQDQGSAITYARRYSLMALLGLSADVDDDGHAAAKTNGAPPIKGGVDRDFLPKRAPVCKTHQHECNLRPAGTSKAGKPYPSFYACPDRECKFTINVADWDDYLRQQEHQAKPSEPMIEPDVLPFEP